MNCAWTLRSGSWPRRARICLRARRIRKRHATDLPEATTQGFGFNPPEPPTTTEASLMPPGPAVSPNEKPSTNAQLMWTPPVENKI